MVEFTIANFITIAGGLYGLGIVTPLALIYVVIRKEDKD